MKYEDTDYWKSFKLIARLMDDCAVKHPLHYFDMAKNYSVVTIREHWYGMHWAYHDNTLYYMPMINW